MAHRQKNRKHFERNVYHSDAKRADEWFAEQHERREPHWPCGIAMRLLPVCYSNGCYLRWDCPAYKGGMDEQANSIIDRIRCGGHRRQDLVE